MLILFIIAALIVYAIIAGVVLYFVERIIYDTDQAVTCAIIWPIGVPVFLLMLLTGFIADLLERIFK